MRAARKKPNDFSTLDFFYRGMWHFNRMTPDDDRMAEALFREVVQRDPELPLGHVGLARVLYSRAVLGASDDPAADLHLSRLAARKAISLDGLDAHGYFAASGASLYLGDHAAAVEEARKANALNPNFSFGNYRLGQVLIFSGYPEEAISPLTRSLRMSPYDPQATLMIETLALAYYQAGDYARAVEQASAAMTMGHARANYLLAAGLAMLGRQKEAEAAYAAIQHQTGPRTRVIAAPYNDPKWRDHVRTGYRMAAGLPLS
jgi:tetratricopeptide (TPR) repeat protein